jgi:vitamin B12 transporter
MTSEFQMRRRSFSHPFTPWLLLVVGASFVAPASGQEPVLPLDTLTVTGSRVSADVPDRTRAVQVWTRDDLDRLPAATVADVLGWTLGVDAMPRSSAQADLSIRGAGFEQLLVLVDGVRMSDPQTGHFDLNLTLPLDQVERIEILRGPASAVYGSDAVGGVVNVVTRRGMGWSGRMEGGSFGTLRASFQGATELPAGGNLRAAAEAGRSDGHRDGTDWDQRLGSVAAALPLGGGSLNGGWGIGRRAFGAEDFYAPFPSFETTRARTAHLGWRSRPGGTVQIEPRLSWRSHGDDFILDRADPGFYRNRHTSTQTGGEFILRAAPRSSVGVAAGLEAARHRLRSNALGEREEDRWAAFAEVALRPPSHGRLGELDLTLGLRHDGHERWGGFTSPSASLALAPREGVRVRGALGRSFRGPSWTERHYRDPAHEAREDLRPERSLSAEIGVDLAHAESGATVRVTAFRRSSRDLVDWARPVGQDDLLWETRNVARATFRGVELEAGARLRPGTRLTVGGAQTSAEANEAAGWESKYALRPLSDQLQVGLSQDLLRGASLELRGIRARRKGDGAFTTADLRVELPVAGGGLYLDGRNLADSEHLDITGNPVAGRAVYMGFVLGAR